MKSLLAKKQKLKENRPTQILERIFVGNYANAIDKDFMSSNNITLIITCLKINDKDRIAGVQYKEILIKDKPEQKIISKFDEFSQIIHKQLSIEKSGKCLVNW